MAGYTGQPTFEKPITDTYLKNLGTTTATGGQQAAVAPTAPTAAPVAPTIQLEPSAPTSFAPTAEQIATAQNAALVGQRKGDITSKLNSYAAMFGGLFGKADAAAADQAATTTANYGTQRTALTDQYNQEVPGIDMSYYLGGVGDSSLRLAGRAKAETALKSSIGGVDANEATDLASIGKELAGLKSGYEADKSNIENIRNSMNQSTDAAELLSLQNEIATKISGLQATTNSMDTAEGFRGKLRSVAPTKDLGPIKQSLTSLFQGAANPALKVQIGKQIVDNADIGDVQKKELYDQFINAPVA